MTNPNTYVKLHDECGYRHDMRVRCPQARPRATCIWPTADVCAAHRVPTSGPCPVHGVTGRGACPVGSTSFGIERRCTLNNGHAGLCDFGPIIERGGTTIAGAVSGAGLGLAFVGASMLSSHPVARFIAALMFVIGLAVLARSLKRDSQR